MSGNYWDLVAQLVDAGKKVFVDLKFFDVPETVASAVRRMKDCGAELATIHGNDAMLAAACAVPRDRLKLLAVTVLTSFDAGDLRDLGVPAAVSVEELVLSRARRALALGCDGVISSGLEARALRDELGEQPADRVAGDPAVREPARARRPEAHRHARGGVPQRRGLHRGRAADPLRARSARGGDGDPGDDRGVFSEHDGHGTAISPSCSSSDRTSRATSCSRRGAAARRTSTASSPRASRRRCR